MQYAIYMVVGLVAGFSSSLLGIGGGVVLVPMLLLIFRLPAHVATATSLAYIAPVALYGALKQAHMGVDVRWALALIALPAGVIGADLGTRLKVHISPAHLKVIFAALMIVVGVRLGLQGLRESRAGPLAAEAAPAAAESHSADPEAPR